MDLSSTHIDYKRMDNNRAIDLFIFKIFVFTLSLGRFIELPFGDFYSKIVPQFSTSVMFVGLSLIIFRKGRIVDNQVLPFVKFWIFSILYTFLACTYLLILYSLGFADGIDDKAWNLEMPYSAIMRDIVFWMSSIMALLYSYYNLRYVISFQNLRNVIELSILAILGIGLLQFGVLKGIGFCSIIYYGLSSIFKLVDFNHMQMLEKGICFWGSEPSSASALSMFIIPYSIITFIKSKGWCRIRFCIYSLILSFLMLRSGSSSTLITIIIVLACTIFYVFKGSIKTWVYIASFSLGLAVVSLYTLDIKISTNASLAEANSVEYIILGKLVDKENGSTATRVATVCNDMKIFASYPLTGIGNGCQGYFYKNNIPEWTKFAEEVRSSLYYESGSIANGGGNFFASYISGYGLIGVVVLLWLIRKYKLKLKKSVVTYNPIAEFTFSVCIIVFLLAGWYVQSIEDNRLMFMLALGCVPNVNLQKK